MTTPTTTPTRVDDLGDQLRRLAIWADACPPAHQVQVSVLIYRLSRLLGAVVADTPDEVTE